jgi:hypothetical protein
MDTNLPSTENVAARLLPLRKRELQDLSDRSGVPYRTLLNIRLGETPNPGLETVRKFFHLLPPVSAEAVRTEAAGQGVANA